MEIFVVVFFTVVSTVQVVNAGYYDGPVAKAETCRSELEKNWLDEQYRRTGILLGSDGCSKYSRSAPYGVGDVSPGQCNRLKSQLEQKRTSWRKQCDRLHKANGCSPSVREIYRRHGVPLENCG